MTSFLSSVQDVLTIPVTTLLQRKLGVWYHQFCIEWNPKFSKTKEKKIGLKIIGVA